MPLNAKLFEKLFGRYKAFTKIVFHTNVEAGIRGVIGLLIGLRPELDGLHIMYVV